MEKLQRNLKGWLKDKPDPRDFFYARTFRVKTILPSKIDLRDKCSFVEDQGPLGSCVGNAVAGAIEFVDLQDKTFRDASRLFIYFNARRMIGKEKEDSGCYIRDAAKSVANEGVCPEFLWPYNVSQFAVSPSKDCYTDALNHQVTSYYRLKTLMEIRFCLAAGFPVIFGFMVYRSALTDKVAKTGIIPYPTWWERLWGPEGGHAVLAVGYDDKKEQIIFRNSWGTGWGDKGYGYLPYKYFTTDGMADDFWTIRKIEEQETV